MSLATRCIACGTIFRIVQDQIKVSEGWVRCGRCDTVFNALEALFDLERDAPPPFAGSGAQEPLPAAPGSSDPDVGVPPSADRAHDHAHFDPIDPIEPTLPLPLDELPTPQNYAGAHIRTANDDDPVSVIPQPEVHEVMPGAPGDSVLPSGYGAPSVAPERAEPYLTVPDAPSSLPPDMSWEQLVAHEARSYYAGEAAAERDGRDAVHSDFEDARFPADAATDFGDDLAPAPATASRAMASRFDPDSDERDSKITTAVEIPLIDEPAPDFVRQADRRAFWQRGAVRTGLAACALLALLGLAAQASYHWRDEMAARWPGTKPWLTNACARLGCRLSAPREIDQIVVESTALTRINAVDAYRLTVVLRNRAEHGVAAPHLDLSLTEVNGGLVARRALAPNEFRSPRAELPPRSESTFELLMSTGALRIAGYTVAVFYP